MYVPRDGVASGWDLGNEGIDSLEVITYHWKRRMSSGRKFAVESTIRQSQKCRCLIHKAASKGERAAVAPQMPAKTCCVNVDINQQ